MAGSDGVRHCMTCLNISTKCTCPQLVEIDAVKVAKLMVDKFRFDPSKENMEVDRTNYSYALLDSLTELYNLEGKIDDALETVRKKVNDRNTL